MQFILHDHANTVKLHIPICLQTQLELTSKQNYERLDMISLQATKRSSVRFLEGKDKPLIWIFNKER